MFCEDLLPCGCLRQWTFRSRQHVFVNPQQCQRAEAWLCHEAWLCRIDVTAPRPWCWINPPPDDAVLELTREQMCRNGPMPGRPGQARRPNEPCPFDNISPIQGQQRAQRRRKRLDSNRKRRRDRHARNDTGARECARAGAGRSTSSGTPVARACCRTCRAAAMEHHSRTSSFVPGTRSGLLPELAVGACTGRTMLHAGLGRTRVTAPASDGGAGHTQPPALPERVSLAPERGCREVALPELGR